MAPIHDQEAISTGTTRDMPQPKKCIVSDDETEAMIAELKARWPWMGRSEAYRRGVKILFDYLIDGKDPAESEAAKTKTEGNVG